MDVEHLVLALLDEQRLRRCWTPSGCKAPSCAMTLRISVPASPPAAATRCTWAMTSEQLLDVAEQERQQQGATSIDERHLLLALASDERLGGALLQRQGLSRSRLRRAIAACWHGRC